MNLRKNLKTLFVWPEGVFSGYSYDEILEFKDTFSENFSEKSSNLIWY